MHRNPRLLMAAALAALVAACGEEQPFINRVQPLALKKEFFAGKDFSTTGTADDPEFWAQQTLVDVGYGAAQDGLFTSTYAQPLTRIKWVIREDQIEARLTYERVQDSDGKGAGRASADGQLVAAFRIESHFDIKRDYNPSTGEQTNVVSENTFDRPWYEREYMRVDWSRNLNTDAYELDTLSQLGIYGSISYEPLAYAITDLNHPDAPHFNTEQGYFDVTTKAFARPQMIDLSHLGWGIDKFPACWLDNDFMGGSAPSGNCNPVELTLRHSFRKVEDKDYEVEDWDGFRFTAYGAFTTDRTGYARNYGMVDSKWHRFINRYNVWKQSHFYADAANRTGAVPCFTEETTPGGADPHRDLNADGTEDECAAVGRGSRCDVYSQKCTLPYRDREPAPVVWYYTDGSNSEYFEGTEWATHDWDVALRQAIMASRYAECVKAGDQGCAETYPVYTGQMDDHEDAVRLAREVDDCRMGLAYGGENCLGVADTIGEARGYSAGVIALAKMEEAIVLCHSPVEAGDHANCGSPRLPAHVTAAMCNAKDRSADVAKACAEAFHVRMGDLRYHQVNSIQIPQTPSPWGIMVDAHDPLTGEKVAASINVWTHVNDLWSQGVVDLSRYVKGELSTEDITEGTYVKDWALAAEASVAGGAAGRFTKESLDDRLAEILGLSGEQFAEARERAQHLDPGLKARVAELNKKVRDIRFDATAPAQAATKYQQRRVRAQHTETEAALARSPGMLQLAGLKGSESAEEIVARASPLRAASLDAAVEFDRRREIALGERGACVMHEAPAPVAVAALANILEEKFGAFNKNDPKDVQLKRAERMRKWIAQRAQYSVIVHEMGHSMGLRHNFVSSSDSFNFRPQYWQLRTENGSVNAACNTLVANGKSCVGPRWFDPPTDNEKNNMISMWTQSTTMDYAGESTQDLLGLGAYDFAAARMFYGDTVAVYADNSFKQNTNRGAGVLDKMDGFGGLLGWQYVIGGIQGTTNIHYSQLQRNFQLIKDCVEVDPQTYKPARWNEERDGAWHPIADGLIVAVDGKYTRCRQQPVDYVQWSAMKNADAKRNAVDGQGRTRVPYGFATDRWADLGNAAVYRHDNGADSYELFDFFIAQQEMNHIFDDYRRGRQTFSIRGAAGRALGRYNEKMRDGAKGLGLLVNIYKDFSLEVGYNFDQLWPSLAAELFGDNLLASGIAFDHFTRQMQRPQSGVHYRDVDNVMRSEEDAYYTPDNPVSLTIPNGATGNWGNVGYGGKPLENKLADDKGEYDSEYTIWAGSYYEKAYTTMLLTESVDNFISSSRNDFLDGRFRAVSLADVFPEGYRRWLANNLTGDAFIKGARVATDAQNRPLKDAAGFPTTGIGWTSWFPASGPQVCFQQPNSLSCAAAPAQAVAIDPQIGWEQQKFLIAWTMNYLPENQQQKWLNMLGIWEIGADNDPGFENRIEFHDPDGKIYVAKTFGKETIFGKTVQKGVAARVLEYANELLEKAYETEAGLDLDGDGRPDWRTIKLAANGQPRVKWDSTIQGISSQGQPRPQGIPGCNATSNENCTCSANRSCIALSRYTEIPVFIRQAMRDYGLAQPSMKGIY